MSESRTEPVGPASRAVDIVLVGGRVRTLDPGRPFANAVALQGDRVVAVGTDEEVRELVGARTEVITLDGAAVLPGLTDGHVHPVMGALMSLGVDLSGLTTLEQVRGALAEAPADRHGWVRGFGLDPNVFEDGVVTTDVLEDALHGQPAVLRLVDAHSMLASREALRRAGITGRERLSPPARVSVGADGTPTGHLVEEEAIGLVEAHVPEVSEADLTASFRQVARGMAAVGLTGGHVMDDLPGTVETLAAVDGEVGLRWRVHGWLRPQDGRARIDELAARVGSAERGGLWRHAGVKLFLDGTVEGGTAWLVDPDSHGEGTVSTWPDPEDYRRAVHELDALGVRTATHAIGDAAVAHAVDVLATTSSPRRHRIEHLETVPDETLDRLAAAGIVASMQPTHCTRCTRGDASDQWSQRLGGERVARGWPIGPLRRRGVTVALGSDWPVAAYDPRPILADAVVRRPVDDVDDRPRQPAHAITALEALEGYTSHAADAIGEPDSGRIRVGALADLTVLEADPAGLAPPEVADVGVVATLVAGRVVHHR